MPTYYKPQSPIQSGEDFIYPITTADQVILSDGSRLEKNGQISIGGTVKTVSGVAPDSAGNVALTANDVGARPDTWMPTASDVGALPAGGTAADSSLLGGKTLAEIMLTLYPVGAVYISVNSTSPASLFGGTWESIGGRFLLGADSTYSAGSMGGESNHTLTVDEMPSHNHSKAAINTLSSGVYTGRWALGSTSASGATTDYTNSTGGGQAHNNMPPYLAVYMWKRVS